MVNTFIAISILFLVELSFQVKNNCDLSKIEDKCELGAAYCALGEFPYCASCSENKILAASYRDVYNCVQIDYTLCSYIPKCLICDEEGSCNYCAIGFTSYNGNCFEKEDNKCDDENCVSCIEDGKICIYCSLEYALSSDHKCVSNKNTINNNCAKYDSNKDSNNDNICSICHFEYLMNYDYKGCRKYNNRSGK